MLNGTIYYRNCKYSYYSKEIEKINNKIKAIYYKLNGRENESIKCDLSSTLRSNLRFCNYDNVDDNTFLSQLKQVMSDYFNKKTIKIKLNNCQINNYQNIQNELEKGNLNQINKNEIKLINDNSNTLFDLCLRNNINYFKSNFSMSNSKSTLESLYNFIRLLPNIIRINNIPLSDLDLKIKCYFKHYINLFFLYDLSTSLLENLKLANEMYKIKYLEMLLNDIIFVLCKIYENIK